MQLTQGWHPTHYGSASPASPELYGFERAGHHLVYDVNSMRLTEISGPAELEGMLKHPEELNPSPWAPAYPLEMPARIGALLFSVTRRCNLACSYCFARSDALRSRAVTDMPIEVILDAYSKLAMGSGAPTRKDYSLAVSYFGGEPLLMFPLIQESVKYARAFLPFPSRHHITTNGTMLTPEIAQYCNQQKFTMIVSLDGSRSAHDMCRVYGNGNGSFEDVMKGLEVLKTYAPYTTKCTTLRSTVTEEGVRKESLRDRVEFLNNLCDLGYADHCSVEPVFLGEDTCFDRNVLKSCNVAFSDPAVQKLWDDQLQEVAQWFMSRLTSTGMPPRYHYFRSFLTRLLNAAPSCSECGGGKGYFSVAPDGTLYACHHEGDTRIGNLSSGVDHKLAAPWQDNRYYSRLRCPSCPIRNVCGGGCREASVANGAGVSMPVVSDCSLKMSCFRSCAWIIAECASKPEWMEKLKSLYVLKQNCSCARA